MLVTSAFVNGAVGGSVIFGGFRGVVGFVGTQPLSCTKRKNARNASSFLCGAMFLLGQDARNRRAASRSKSVKCERPWSAANSSNWRNSRRYLYSIGSRRF